MPTELRETRSRNEPVFVSVKPPGDRVIVPPPVPPTDEGGWGSAPRTFYIPALDGIRAVAFAIVFASHALSEQIPGGFGVTIFFFLSGYLITTLLRIEREKTGTISLRNFYARRALRILPNFYIVLALATALAYFGLLQPIGGSLKASGVAWQALYANNYYSIFFADVGTALGTGILWSLSVEEHFYFIFPLLFLALLRFSSNVKLHVAVLAISCGLILAWRFAIVFATSLPADSYTYKASDARFDSILFGCILALWGNPMMDRSRLSNRMWLYVAAPIALLAMLSTFLIRDDTFRWTLRYSIQGLALMPLFVVAIRCYAHPALRWLAWPIVRWVGTLTYTLYLVHLIVLYEVQPIMGGSTAGRISAALTAFGVSLLIAVAMARLVERPLAAWRKRLHAEARASKPEGAAAR